MNRNTGRPEHSEAPLTPEQIAYYRARLRNPVAHIDELLSESIPTGLCVGLLSTGKKRGKSQFERERDTKGRVME